MYIESRFSAAAEEEIGARQMARPRLRAQALAGALKHSTRHGSILVRAQDRPIADALSHYGEWAQIEIDFIAQFIRDEAVVLDIGGHVGIHARAFARAAKNVTVHSFEAQPQLAQLLTLNAQNAAGQVHAHSVAIGDKIGRAYISALPDDGWVNAGAQSIRSAKRAGDFSVDVTTIDSQGFSRVDFIKMDIGGHEAAALRGASNTIDRCRPVIFCEVKTIEQAARIFEEISLFDYSVYFVSTAAHNVDNFKKKSKNIFGVAHGAALLLLPKKHKAPSPVGASVCMPVTGSEKLAPHFVAAPRHGDDIEHDRSIVALHEELRAARQATETAAQQLASTQAKLAEQQDALSLYQLRHDRLAGFVSHDHVAARRKGVLGALSRRFGRSQLARTCRKLINSGLFDRRWYKASYPDVAASHYEPVVHYILYGAYEGRDPCSVFDTSYYLENNDDVRKWGGNPLLHYIDHGERELRWPNPKFDPETYLKANPQARRDIPLLRQHQLSGGGVEPVQPPYRPTAPDWGAFIALVDDAESRSAGHGSSTVDIIVPVYRGYSDTLACLLSVLESPNRTDFELVVIDDASPEPELSAALEQLAAMGLITLLRNDRNLGFVATVNRGIDLHPDRDVLLLNSDTLVFNDWLDRLRSHCLDGSVGTATPFTNNGTICSYPKFCVDNPGLQDISFAEIDSLAAAVNRGASVEVPTGVGFCMYVTRSALNAVGLFDVETFGRGYGEENDFCWRVSAMQMKNLHVLDVFVFHSGETSFSTGAAQAKRDGYQALVNKHPDYPATVQRYIKSDPAKTARARLDLARLVGGSFDKVALCFTHAWGGGIEKYLRDRAQLGKLTGEAILCAIPVGGGAGFRITNVYFDDTKLNLHHFRLVDDIEELKDQLEGIVTHIEVHSTVRWGGDVLRFVPKLAAELGAYFDFMLHDYAAICPQINLMNGSGRYCGETGVDQCRLCLSQNQETPQAIHPDWKARGMDDIMEWRQRYQEFLSQARELVAPSQDVIDRVSRYLPPRPFILRPHVEPDRPSARDVAVPYQGGKLRVAIIGAIGDQKGAAFSSSALRMHPAGRFPSSSALSATQAAQS
ncbi:FkbM family methyltransferase [Mesorhizobium sp. ANAO-SY3R2]|uniref:FkbM family methyltransferase n=1 Tax=Mesorhizobium sp. ANAO-SY3R2 TaxID=3166644 RepID=UPI0036704A70